MNAIRLRLICCLLTWLMGSLSLVAQEGTPCCSLLTFEEAAARIVTHSPTLKVFEDAIGKAVGTRTQAGLLPNPIAAWSVENIWGNDEWQGWDSAESRYEVDQLIELGGKMGYRYRAAGYEVCAMESAYELAKVVLYNQLLKRFALVAANIERVALAEEQLSLAKQVFSSVSEKVDAGRVSPIQRNKAQITLSSADLDLQTARTALAQARDYLALLWGSNCPDFDGVDFPFYVTSSPYCLDECVMALCEHPEILRLKFEEHVACQEWNLEKANAIPDVTVLMGYKTENERNHHGFIIGAALPIPIFNQNQGNIYRAGSEVYRIRDKQCEVRVALENKLRRLHRELVRTYEQASQMQSTIIKAADDSFESAREGYASGKFEYLEMLDSQRTLFDVKAQYIDVLLRYHECKADIQYLNNQGDS